MILNLSNVIQEDQLQYLQFATEFATFSSSTQNQMSKPFQKLLFLIRDWQNVDDFEFGFDGGRHYLDQVLKFRVGQSEELKSVREHLRNSFDELSCCLMPYPGKKVATSSNYDGRWNAMDEDFLAELKILIENFLQKEKLISKKVNGVSVTAGEFFEIIKNYLTIFSSSGNLPKAKNLYELTVGKFLTELIQKCFEIYEANLNENIEKFQDIDEIHRKAENSAISTFENSKKMGNITEQLKFKNQLMEKIQTRELEFKIESRKKLRILLSERQKAIAAQRETQSTAIEREKDEISQKIDHVRKLFDIQDQRNEARKKHEKEMKEIQEKIRREKERQRNLQ